MRTPASARPATDTTQTTLRVVVADDSTLIREGLVRVLERGGLDVVACADNADDLVSRARAHRPDVVVTDIQMPPDFNEDGLRAASQLRATNPEIGVIVLSQFLEDEFALTLVGDCRDRVGYLLKDRIATPDVLLDAVHTIAAGGTVLDPEVVRLLVGQRRVDSPLDNLTARERDVLALMAEGRSNQGIAAALYVTVPAIERHVTGIFGKLGLAQTPADHRRVLAVLNYLSE